MQIGREKRTLNVPLFREIEFHRQASRTLNSFVSSIPGAGLPEKSRYNQNHIESNNIYTWKKKSINYISNDFISMIYPVSLCKAFSLKNKYYMLSNLVGECEHWFFLKQKASSALQNWLSQKPYATVYKCFYCILLALKAFMG